MTIPVAPDQRREIQRQCEELFLTALVHVLYDFDCDQLRIIERVTGGYLTRRDGAEKTRLMDAIWRDTKEQKP